MFKPFVYLTAFEQAAEKGRTDVTPASIVDDSPSTWEFDNQVWTPQNYEDEYDGPTTYRHALAHSRNIAAIKVAEQAGYGNVAALWKKLGVGNPPKAYPSIALGVFEATPLEIATAYTIFPNLGVLRPLQNLLKVTRGAKEVTKPRTTTAKSIARPETTYLVTNMLRSVLTEGTAAASRGMGFHLTRPERPGPNVSATRGSWASAGSADGGLGGLRRLQPAPRTAGAPLPIWVEFMKRARPARKPELRRAGRVSFVDIDKDNGKLATPLCPPSSAKRHCGTEPVVLRRAQVRRD